MGISDPHVTVYCDNYADCRAQEDFDMTPLARGSFDNRGLEKEMERSGWVADGESVYCADCWEDLKERNGE